MAVDLSVSFCGVKFKNPFLLSPSPATRAKNWSKAAKAGWGGAVTWTGELMRPEGVMVGCAVPHGVKFIDRPPSFWSFGTGHASKGVNPNDTCPVERVEWVVRTAKQSGLPAIVNIMGTLDFDKWLRSCIAAEKSGADILEVNPSYAVSPNHGLHLGFATDLDKTRKLLGLVRQKIKIPIMVKLSAFLVSQQIRDWAKACVESGADAISITNSIPGVVGVDVETGRPLTTLLDDSGELTSHIMIVDGPAIRSIGLAGVASVRSVVDVPIAAIGGVADWYSAVEYMMLGASVVEVGSAALAYGYRMARDLSRGLAEFMQRKGYSQVQDFIGITSQKYHVGKAAWHDSISLKQPFKTVVDEAKCTGCGRCMLTCEASADSAMSVKEGMATINQEICWKCGMCKLVCPEGAISVVWEPAYAPH